MSIRVLGHTAFNVGRYSGRLAGCPNYRMRYRLTPDVPLGTHKYQWSRDIPRMLYHSALNEVVHYPCIPDETHGFGFDILAKRALAESQTLTSNATAMWDAVLADVTIKEVWTADGGLSAYRSFFEALYRFYRTLLGSDGYLLWRPLDLTDKVYRARITNVLVGGENMDLKYVGTSMPDKWLSSQVEMHLKIVPTPVSSVNVFATGNLLV